MPLRVTDPSPVIGEGPPPGFAPPGNPGTGGGSRGTFLRVQGTPLLRLAHHWLPKTCLLKGVTPESCAAPGTAAVSSGLPQPATAALFPDWKSGPGNVTSRSRTAALPGLTGYADMIPGPYFF